jgi:ribosomal protein S18 acetylase RimI-like enzyme
MIKFIQAESDDELDSARLLFREYEESLNSKICFQDFEKELASLPGEYAPPDGRLILAVYRGEAVGCVAIKKVDDGICKMKRLYVQPDFRQEHVGRGLADAAIDEAIKIGYKKMILHTLPSMKAAISLYKSLDFKTVASSDSGEAIYMELELDKK